MEAICVKTVSAGQAEQSPIQLLTVPARLLTHNAFAAHFAQSLTTITKSPLSIAAHQNPGTLHVHSSHVNGWPLQPTQ